MIIDLQQHHKELDQSSALVRIPIANEGLKCTLPQWELERALTLVFKSIPKRRSNPLSLFHVFIQADTSSIRLCGTNATSALVVYQPAQVERMGDWSVDAKLLLSCVKTFACGQDVMLEVRGGELLVWSSTRSFLLKCGGLDFPDLKLATPLPFYCTVGSKDLRKAIRSVEFVADEYAARSIFTSFGLHLQSDTCGFMTADGYQLAQCTFPLEQMEGRDTILQIPASSMRLLLQILPKKEDTPVAIRWNTNDRAEFECGDVRLITSLLLETFPNVAIPNVPKTTFTLVRSALLQLLKAFKPFTEESANILRLSYQSGGAVVVFSASCDDLGSACDGLETQVEGSSGQVIFNAGYLMSLMDALTDESLTFSLSGPDSPCFVHPVGHEDSYQYILMPIHKIEAS